MKKPLILITNDDGITAPGIRALIRIMNDFGDVYVVAPNQSLAQYIVTTMYPEFDSLCIDDEPITPESYSKAFE